MAATQQVIFLAFLAASLFYAASAIPGTATFYTGNVASACYGSQNKGIWVAAAPRNIYNNGAACGKLYRMKCTSGTNQGVPHPCRNGEIIVKVVDFCPSCQNNQFDLYKPAFLFIANPDAVKINIDFTRAATVG